jgi:hypothetical protein
MTMTDPIPPQDVTGSSSMPDASPLPAGPAAERPKVNIQSVALLAFGIVAIIAGAVFLASGLTEVEPTSSDLAGLPDVFGELGVRIRDQVTGALAIFAGIISLLLWLTVGALRRG